MNQHLSSLLTNDEYQWLKTLDDKDRADQLILSNLCETFYDNNEFWVACKVLEMLIQFGNKSIYHNSLEAALKSWDKSLIDQAQKEYEKAIELEPEGPVFIYNYASCFYDTSKFKLAL